MLQGITISYRTQPFLDSYNRSLVPYTKKIPTFKGFFHEIDNSKWLTVRWCKLIKELDQDHLW